MQSVTESSIVNIEYGSSSVSLKTSKSERYYGRKTASSFSPSLDFKYIVTSKLEVKHLVTMRLAPVEGP